MVILLLEITGVFVFIYITAIFMAPSFMNAAIYSTARAYSYQDRGTTSSFIYIFIGLFKFDL